MKVLFLTKRRPQNKDLYSRPYGRFFNIPRLLADAGVEVDLVLGSYQNEPEFSVVSEGMAIHSRRIFPSIAHFYRSVRELAEATHPDVVVGFSDTWFGIVAARLAGSFRARLVIDAYDNYEAYIPWATPLHWLWHRALAKADGLTAAGPQLLDLLAQHNNSAQRLVVPMSADQNFIPMPAAECRLRLELPPTRKLIGYLGSAHKSRGFELFHKALALICAQRNDFDLVISGRSSVQIDIPADRLHDVGYVADDLMPALISSCDLLVCLNQNSAFGNYSYPIKIYEALACARPVLASDTVAARWIMNNEPRCLAEVGNPGDLATKIMSMLDRPVLAGNPPAGWKSSADLFYGLLHDL